MKSQFLNPVKADSGTIAEAANILKAGGLVAFPTETVYGLGACAKNVDAVRRIFATKGRPADHPLIVHLGSAAEIDEWARDIPDSARLLADRFWPGALTLVLLRQPWVPDEITGGQDTVALRMPAQPVAQKLIRLTGALAAPSANRFGRVSPTTAMHVYEELGNNVDLILDDGPCMIGVESTILAMINDRPVLLRPGGISVEALQNILGRGVELPTRHSDPRAPGGLPGHYAPEHALVLVGSDDLRQQASALIDKGLKVAVMSLQLRADGKSNPNWVQMPSCAEEYARLLYATLRNLDAGDCDIILVETPPDSPEWLAVRDRLMRAAFKS